MSKFLVVVFVSVLAFANATNFKQCTNGRPSPLSVDVEGCSVLPCIVVKGTTVAISVRFAGARDNTTSLQAKVKATALGITIPYTLPEDEANVCLNLANNATCPINLGEEVVYKINFYVDPLYPAISASIEASIVDENNVTVACAVVDVRARNAKLFMRKITSQNQNAI